MSDLSVDAVREIDPNLVRYVERLNMAGMALANAVMLNEQGDNSVKFSRFYGSLIYKLGEEQKILCQLILVYCRYLEKQISSSDHLRYSNLRELAEFVQQLEVKADETLAQVAAFCELDQQGGHETRALARCPRSVKNAHRYAGSRRYPLQTIASPT